MITKQIDNPELAFMHYALKSDELSFKDFVDNPTPNDLDSLFNLQVDFVFYGHTHKVSDHQGRARYINQGSLGCQKSALAPYVIVNTNRNQCEIEQCLTPYNDQGLFDAFEERTVPEREFIYEAFLGGRFPAL